MVKTTQTRPSAFTLVELLAVMLVILLLAAITIGIAGSIQKRVASSTTRAQVAAIAAALEMYKADWGFYPATAPGRISATGFWESTNNFILYRALSGVAGKRYMRFPVSQLRVGIGSGSSQNTNGGLMNICDPWGAPYNYYCSPATSYAVSNAIPAGLTNTYWYGGYAVGGQVNVSSYDLFSYGPDKSTYVPGAIAYQGGYNYAWYYDGGSRWTNTTKALDDVTNFGR